MEKLNFYDLSLEQLTEYLLQRNEKKFRAQQLFRWVYLLGISDFDEMTNLSKASRELYKEWFFFALPQLINKQESEDGTKKFLFGVGEGRSVEAVIIPSGERNTLCISSEVGCNLGCQFCYTGTQKLKKRLSPAEIVGQYLQVKKELKEDQKITNIVYMGMGEPLDNSESVFTSVEILHSSWGINLSRKKITISTSGLVDQIPLVTESGVRLAVSLNAVTNEVRSQIMPINKKWPIETLLDACRTHARLTRDKITMEYVLLKGVTDSIADARKLHKLTANVPCKINVIPFNEHPCSSFKRPSEEQIVAFQEELMRLGAQAYRRKTMGKDILAACGQLADVKQEI